MRGGHLKLVWSPVLNLSKTTLAVTPACKVMYMIIRGTRSLCLIPSTYYQEGVASTIFTSPSHDAMPQVPARPPCMPSRKSTPTLPRYRTS